MGKYAFQVNSLKKLYAKHKVYIDGMIAIVFIAIIFHQTPIELLVRLLDNVNDLDFKFVSVFQNLSLALLTVLIPIGIAIFQIVDERPKFKILQRRVLLSKVFSLNKLIFTVPFLFLPFVMWKIIYLRSFMVLLWGIAVGVLIAVLFKLSRWMADDAKFKFNETVSYLEEVSGEDELIEAFDAVWNYEHPFYPFEELYFNVFKNRINDLIKHSKVNEKIVSSLLDNFFLKLELRTSILISYGEVLKNSLEWYSIVLNYKKTNKSEYWGGLTKSFRVYIKQLYMKLFINNEADYFFEEMKNWIHKSENDAQIVEDFFDDLIEDDFLVQVINNHAWDGFPPEWLISNTNIFKSSKYESKDNLIRSIIYEHFMNRVSDNLFGNGEFDIYLEELNKNLFPDVDPIIWSRILVIYHIIFDQRDINIKRDKKDIMKLVLNTKKGFGYSGRIKPYWKNKEGNLNNENKKELENTFNLARTLLGNIFSDERLNQLDSELEDFKIHENYSKYKNVIAGLKISNNNINKKV